MSRDGGLVLDSLEASAEEDPGRGGALSTREMQTSVRFLHKLSAFLLNARSGNAPVGEVGVRA
jgi:hypothetical protein